LAQQLSADRLIHIVEHDDCVAAEQGGRELFL